MKNLYHFLHTFLAFTINKMQTRLLEDAYSKNTRIGKDELGLFQSNASFERLSLNIPKKAYNLRLRVRKDIFHIDIIFMFY